MTFCNSTFSCYGDLTYADDNEGSSSVKDSQPDCVEGHSVEEHRQREAEEDGGETPECEPGGEGREHQHDDEDGSQGDACHLDVVPERPANLVVKQLVASIQHLDLTVKKNKCEMRLNIERSGTCKNVLGPQRPSPDRNPREE